MTQILPRSHEKDSGQGEAQPHSSQRRFLPKLLLLGTVLMITASGTFWYRFYRPTATDTLSLSGRIEGYETDIGAKIPGRIDFVAVREGDAVKRGQVVVRLDDDEIQAQLQGATAQIAAARQQVEQARWQIGVVESQIAEAQLNLEQARGQAQGQIYQAEANLAAAQAQLNQAQAQLNQARAELNLARKDRDRFAQLYQEGVVTQQRLDQTQTTYDTALATLQSRQAGVKTAERQVNAAQGALTAIQTSSLNPTISQARIQALQNQLTAAQAQLRQAQQQVKVAEANRQQIQAQIAYLNVVSPINGVVTARSVEPGAVVTGGKTLLTVINPDTVYLRGFIPEGDIGKVRVGQRAEVFLDSAPDQPLGARVTAIDTQASFTPENIYFRQDRVRQVFGVKIGIEQPGGWAKPGMPADAQILMNPTRAK